MKASNLDPGASERVEFVLTGEQIRRVRSRGIVWWQSTDVVRGLEPPHVGGWHRNHFRRRSMHYTGFDFQVIDAAVTNFHLPRPPCDAGLSSGRVGPLREAYEECGLNASFYSYGMRC